MSEEHAALPRLMVITQSDLMGSGFELALLQALRGGARWVQLREKEASPRALLEMSFRALRLCETYGARLSINGRVEVARSCHAWGVHLAEGDLPAREMRSILGHHAGCGVSVHSIEAARRAWGEGADYLLFGPVFPTLSHSGAEAQGLEALRKVAGSVKCPVLAVGGIDAANAKSCLDAGAHGAAVIRAAWKPGEGSVEQAVQALCAAVGQEKKVVSHLPAHLAKS